MRCASYVRYTSCMPERNTPTDIIRLQNERIRKFIKDHGWVLTEKYTDRKQDPKADDAFRQMREDGISRKFDMVVVDSLFRCGVNVSYAEDVLLKIFYYAGIHFSVVEDNFCSMLLTVDEVEAYFKKKRNFGIAGTLRRHKMEQYLNAVYSVHDERYGYVLSEDRKSLVIDKTVAPIIRDIFYLIGEKDMTYQAVANLMNERGVESPMKHLVHTGQKHRPDVISNWTGTSVKRIAENTAYAGYWYRTLGGERIKMENEPIVDQALFDKVAAKYEKYPTRNLPRVQKSENAFIKQIFDKTSGRSLMCKLHRVDEPYQTFSLEFWSKKKIHYDKVMEEVVSFLRKEQYATARALQWIMSDDGFRAKEERRAFLARRAKGLFDELVILEEQHLLDYCNKENGYMTTEEYSHREKISTEKRSKNERAFQEIMEQLDELELLFSKRNPWIVFYGNLKISDKLTKNEIRKWLDKVFVENFETVEVVLLEKYTAWRDKLPNDWRE